MRHILSKYNHSSELHGGRVKESFYRRTNRKGKERRGIDGAHRLTRITPKGVPKSAVCAKVHGSPPKCF